MDMTDEQYIEQRRFQDVVNKGLVPKLRDSAVCLSVVSDSEELDAKFCTELGAMILLDKPILAIVLPGQTISKKFEMVADRVVHADIATPDGQAALAKAIADFTEETS